VLERQLAGITLAPYIVRAMRLIDVPRKAGSNMFRHQMSTLAILLDYKLVDPVLLKASVIHDLFEELGDEPWVTREAIASIDADGPAVYDLVMEVTRRSDETKLEYMQRVLEKGSYRAKILKCADRISNLVALGFVNDREFVERYLRETRARFVKGPEYIRNAGISPSGARAVFEFRGEIVTVPAEKGDARNPPEPSPAPSLQRRLRKKPGPPGGAFRPPPGGVSAQAVRIRFFHIRSKTSMPRIRRQVARTFLTPSVKRTRAPVIFSSSPRTR